MIAEMAGVAPYPYDGKPRQRVSHSASRAKQGEVSSRRKERDAKSHQKKLSMIGWAQKIFGESKVVERKLGMNYLQSRGLAEEMPCSLRVHLNLQYKEQDKSHSGYGKRQHFPALICPISRGFNAPVEGIQRIYLQKDGKGKAPVSMPKMALGQKEGGAVWMSDDEPWPHMHYGPQDQPCEPGEIWVCEGIETGIALYQYLDAHHRGRHAWAVAAAVDAGNMLTITIPSVADRVVIAADKDRNNAGLNAAIAAARAFKRQGHRGVIKLPPMDIPHDKKSVDWLDFIVAAGIGGATW
jgi:hypothetical protein